MLVIGCAVDLMECKQDSSYEVIMAISVLAFQLSLIFLIKDILYIVLHQDNIIVCECNRFSISYDTLKLAAVVVINCLLFM